MAMACTFGVFGEVLFDRFSDGYQILGGAPFNVAWHLQAFGQDPLFISRVGADSAGAEIRGAMQDWGLSIAGLQTDYQHPTGCVSVTVLDGEPSYQILSDQAYDFIEADLLPETACRILYHGSLAMRQAVSGTALAALKVRQPGLVLMDVNLRAPWWDYTAIQESLAAADWVKLNAEELRQLDAGAGAWAERMPAFIEKFQLSGLIVTLGAAGALAMTADGDLISVKPEQAVQVVDCVGAGDAFAAVALLGIQLGWPLALTLQRAQRFAAAIVGQRGAIPQQAEFYRSFRLDWLL